MTKKLTSGLLFTFAIFFGAGLSFGQFIPNAPFKAELLKAPDFFLKDLDGKTFHLSKQAGKPVLLFFGATWCPACRTEIPNVKKLHAQYTPRGLQVAYINIGEPAKRVARFAKTHQLPYRVLLDEDEVVADQYNILGVPTFILIDSKGILINVAHRSTDLSLTKLFPEKQPGGTK